MVEILRMGGVEIRSQNPLTLRKFYCESFGFREISHAEVGGKLSSCWAALGDIELYFSVVDYAVPPVRLIFYVNDLKSYASLLRAKGIDVQERHSGTFDIGLLHDYARMVSLRDPDGNKINLYCVEPGWRRAVKENAIVLRDDFL